MQELPKLRRWEKWGLAALILALGLSRGVDTRDDSATKPDVLEYANATLQFALHIVAIWVVLNARRVFEWLFGILAEIMIQRGLVFVVPPPKDGPSEPADENETAEEAARRGHRRLLRKADLKAATEAHRAKMRERLRAIGIDWVGPLLAFIVVMALVPIFLQTPRTSRDVGRDPPSLPATQYSDNSQRDGAGSIASCLPEYCSAGDGGAHTCRVPLGADPTSIARDLLPSTATELEVARLASQIWNDNRHVASLANRTDRQIPQNTELQIRATLVACER
jgi:hypothetical protein